MKKVLRKKKGSRESFRELEREARDTSDLRPLTPAMRREWQAAKRTGGKPRRGRPPKDPRHRSRIVPISIEPGLLDAADRYASAAGISRSRLVAEALRLRIKS